MQSILELSGLGIDILKLKSCTFSESWKQPLYDPLGNTVNPCFMAIVFIGFNALFGFLVLKQLIDVTIFNHFGPYKIKYSFGSVFDSKSVGIFTLLRLNSIFIQCILSAILFSFEFSSLSEVKSISLLTTLVLLVGLVLPLHLCEPTRSVIPATSLLYYWLYNTLLNLVVFAQDVFSAHKMYAPESNTSIKSMVLVIEVFALINAIAIFALEWLFYQPSVELIDFYDLNEWDYRRVRDVFTRLFFTHYQNLIFEARETNSIDTETIPSFTVDLDNEVAYLQLLKYWNKSVSDTEKKNKILLEKSKKSGKPFTKKTPSLFLPLVYLTKQYFWGGLFFDLLEFGSLIIQPYLLNRFLKFASNRYLLRTQNKLTDSDVQQEPIIVGFVMASLIYLFAVMTYISFNRNFYNSQGMSDKISTSLSTLVYNKSMVLSPKERKEKSVGEIVSNMAQDVQTLTEAPSIITGILTQPIRLVLYMYTLYNFLGIASAVGLGAALILIPLASISYTIVVKEMKKLLKFKDKRAKLTSEILNSIKSIKLYSWENSMLDKLDDIRNNNELISMRKIGFLMTVINLFWDSIPFFIALSTFVFAAVVSKVKLTPEIIFPALNIFDSLSGPILQIPGIMTEIATSKVSIARLVKLFMMDELNVPEYEKTNVPTKKGETSVSIKDATFVWTPIDEKDESVPPVDEEINIESDSPKVDPIALKDIDFEAKKGALTCIVGRVGSGKTTFLKTILGCIPVDSRTSSPVIKVNGSVAYCAQNAWILNSSVRENILFGRTYNKAFYHQVLEACELTKDLDILPDGDRTVVGEKGISLSGGQKARLSLARAVYSKADIYILDDVLSAVDTHVGKNIIKNVLSKAGLLASKTVILATNSVAVLHEADTIILLEGKTISESGTFDQVMSTESNLAQLIKEFGKKEEEKEEVPETIEEELDELKAQSGPNLSSSEEDELEVTEYKPLMSSGVPLTKVETNVTVPASLVSFGHNYLDDFDDASIIRKTGDTEEIKSKGKVNLSIYLQYVKACGYSSWILYVIASVLAVLVGLLTTLVLKHWSELNTENPGNVSVLFYLFLYGGVGVLGLLCSLASAYILFAVVSINGGKYYHDTMSRSVLRSPMSFFETTPAGRILNRFTEDISSVDNRMLWSISYFVSSSFKALIVFVVVIFNLPFMFLVMFALLFLYDSFRKSFIPASRELKRLSSARKSPIFSHLQESVTGVETIIAYNQIDRFGHKCQDNLNKFVAILQANLACNRWLSMRLQSLSAIVVFVSTILVVLSMASSNPMSPGLVGFIMVYVLEVTRSLNGIVRTYADIETRSITLERLVEYCNLKPEAPMVIEDTKPSESWPQKGQITFKEYETKYRENLDPVLRNLSITINSQEKVGIVGRTGAGKSTLTLALFRIIEASHGHIEIDGVDTSKLGLFDLRSKLNIIPQDSHAINGSVRENLDPFEKHTDEELWKVLELSHLKDHIQNMKTEQKSDDDDDDDDDDNKKEPETVTGLDAIIEEGGSNLSAGQKQLMCLARALLNPSKILILDEATASVDVQTDKIVQDTIRSEFKDKTILTIAHRLETIMDSDKILVLDKGEVAEFDSPLELLKNTEGIFYSLCKQGGHL